MQFAKRMLMVGAMVGMVAAPALAVEDVGFGAGDAARVNITITATTQGVVQIVVTSATPALSGAGTASGTMSFGSVNALCANPDTGVAAVSIAAGCQDTAERTVDRRWAGPSTGTKARGNCVPSRSGQPGTAGKRRG